MKRTSRKPSILSDSLHRQLNSYALAASAAGVGVLALAQPAEAKIIYTPAHRYVPLNRPLNIDLNRDGVADLWISRSSWVSTTSQGSHVSGTFLGAGGDGMAGYHPTTQPSAFVLSALHAGQRISSGLQFYVRGDMAGRVHFMGGSGRCSGDWNNVKNRYLGLRFYYEFNRRVHYGWARLSESCDLHGKRGKALETLLTGYAYETIPNKPIIAGKTHGKDVVTVQPASLGHLARGAAAIPAWRGKE